MPEEARAGYEVLMDDYDGECEGPWVGYIAELEKDRLARGSEWNKVKNLIDERLKIGRDFANYQLGHIGLGLKMTVVIGMFIQELEPTHVAFILNKITMANSSKKFLEEYWDGQPKRTRRRQLIEEGFYNGCDPTSKDFLVHDVRLIYHWIHGLRNGICLVCTDPRGISSEDGVSNTRFFRACLEDNKRPKTDEGAYKNYVKNFRDPGVKEDMSLKSEFTDWTETARSNDSGLGNQSSPLEISRLRRIYYSEAYAKPDAATALLLQYVDDLNAKHKDPRYLPANLSHLDIPKMKEQIKAEAAHRHLRDKLEAFKMTAKTPTSPALARCVRYEKGLEGCRAEGRAALPRMKLRFESKNRPRTLDILRLALSYSKPSLSTKAVPVLSKQFTAQGFADALNHWGVKWVEKMGQQRTYDTRDANRLIVYLHACDTEPIKLAENWKNIKSADKKALIKFEKDVKHGKDAREKR